MSETLIRVATKEDFQAVVKMASNFYKESDIIEKITGEYNKDHIENIVNSIIESESSDIFVAEKGGRIFGMMILVIIPVLFSPACKMAQEVAWWVEPEERKGGIGKMLLEAALGWAKGENASVLSMAALQGNTDVARMYVNSGFRLLESTYCKKL